MWTWSKTLQDMENWKMPSSNWMNKWKTPREIAQDIWELRQSSLIQEVSESVSDWLRWDEDDYVWVDYDGDSSDWELNFN